MKKLAGVVVGILLTVTAGWAQDPTRLYTEPAVPPQEALDRLNLQMAWRVYLPTDKRRDGIFSVHTFDGGPSAAGQVIVQSRSGAVTALDATTGAIVWRSVFGKPYSVTHPLGFNDKSVFALNGPQLFSLSRATGQVEWEFALPNTPTSAPAADDERVYVTLGTGRLNSYQFPKPAAPAAAPAPAPARELQSEPPLEPGAKPPAFSAPKPYSVHGVSGRTLEAVTSLSSKGRSIQAIGPLSSAAEAAKLGGTGSRPELLWEYLGETRLEITPLLTPEFLVLGGYSGAFYAMSRFDGRLLYRFQAGPPLTAPIGQYGETAYVASQDFTVYALDVVPGHILWRFMGGGPIQRKPVVTDTSVFVTPERAGLYRLERSSGATVWHNANGQRFVSANLKFVYATDSSGRLLILERERGTQLAIYDGTRDFVVPISNEHTDRLYLASNDGLLLCLHDKEYKTPLRMRTVADIPSGGAGEPSKTKPVK